MAYFSIGVGPKEHIASFNISVIQDLPGVGQNLQEHVCYSGLTFVVNDTTAGVTSNSLLNIKNFLQFFEKGKGKNPNLIFNVLFKKNKIDFTKTNIMFQSFTRKKTQWLNLMFISN